MQQELARHGVVHELVTDPEWGHGFDVGEEGDPKVQKALERVVAFLVELTSTRS